MTAIEQLQRYSNLVVQALSATLNSSTTIFHTQSKTLLTLDGISLKYIMSCDDAGQLHSSRLTSGLTDIYSSQKNTKIHMSQHLMRQILNRSSSVRQ